jgi:hypothetical protein
MAVETGLARSGFRAGAFDRERSNPMDRDESDKPGTDDLPSNDKEIARQGEKNRKDMDDIPAHGTDPLHEGP